MAKFLLRRVIFLTLTLIFVSIAIFVITELAPGNIAVNTLGNTITPEQEASFNAQNGLDQTPRERDIRFIFGSDWQVEDDIGYPITRVFNEDTQTYDWWAVDGDTWFQTYTEDGEQMIRRELQADGTTVDVPITGDPWQLTTLENGEQVEVFWGVDGEGHAAMWVRGDDLATWTLSSTSWTSAAGAPRKYIPLQRGLLRGDPGISFSSRRPVGITLFSRLKNTAILAGIAFVVVMPVALVLGLVAGLNEGKLIDRVSSISSLIATATPEFASGVFLIVIFSSAFVRNTLGLQVPTAVVVTSENSILARPQMLILPVLTLTLIELGYVLRITRASMVEVMRTNYIRTAVLKGLPRWRIVMKHALRNALLAPITIIMLHVNWLIGGIVIVETLFGFPGLGRYILEVALFKDVFAIESAAMIMVVLAVVTQLLADLMYTYLNPRIRYS